MLLIIGTAGCDRVAKNFAETHLSGGATRSFVMDTVRLEYTENAGAFLSLGANWPAPVRTGVFTIGNAILLLAAIIAATRERWSGPALFGTALFVTGGVSNLVDRVVRGSVIDFMNVGIGPLRTGIFNVADVAIMLGLAMVAVVTFRSRDHLTEHGS